MSILFIGETTLNSLLISLMAGIYEVVAWLFQVFIILSRVEPLKTSVYDTIIKNMYILLAVVMLFIIAFSMLKSMVNPEEEKGTEQSIGIIKKFITSIIILIFLPTIFNFALAFQTAIINQNTIGKLFSNSFTTGDQGTTFSQIGNSMANSVFVAFFSPNLECDVCTKYFEENDTKDEDKLQECKKQITGDKESLFKTEDDVNNNGSFGMYSNFGENVKKNEINFNFLIGILAGLYLLYVITSFCLDLGVRLVKLIFYQIIAPIPVMFRMVPNEKISGTFNSWIKVTATCYVEVFLRLFIIYLGVFLVSAITRSGILDIYTDGKTIISIVVYAIVILGIVTFIKQAPGLISDITGIDSSNMKLGIREKLADGGLFAAGAVAGGALTAGIQNGLPGIRDAFKNKSFKTGFKAIGSSFAGAASGGYHGLKSGVGAKSFVDMKNAASSGASKASDNKQQRELELNAAGGSYGKYFANKVGNVVGSVQDWAGLSKIDVSESKRYDEAASAFDAAHTMAEGVYKGKPGHDALKEKVSTAKASLAATEKRQLELQQQIDRHKELSAIVNRNEEQEIEFKNLSEKRVNLQAELESSKATLTELKNNVSVADAELKAHEAAEMNKKSSVVMESVNKLVQSKIQFSDIAGDIITNNDYAILEKAGLTNLANKIKNNELIKLEDISTADKNTLEKFLDQVGINAKNIAANKRVEVAHATALKNRNSGSDGNK